MCQIHRAPPGAAQEARTVDHVGPALLDRLQELGIVAGIVFEVGILDQNKLALRGGDTGPNSGALTLVLLVHDQAKLRDRLCHFGQNVPGAVGGPIIDNDDLFCQPGLEHTLDDFPDGGGFIEHWDDNRESHAAHCTAWEQAGQLVDLPGPTGWL